MAATVTGPAPPTAPRRVKRRRHPWRTASAIVVGLLFALLCWALARNPNFDWPTVGRYLFEELTLRGLAVTLFLTVASMIIGIVGGVLVAVMSLSTNYVLRAVAGLYVWFFRGTPVLVQIIFWGFLGALFPHIVIGIPFTDIVFVDIETSRAITATMAAVLALGLNEIAYASEIVRGGIKSVDAGQYEAAASIGLGPVTTMRRIVLPQAMRVIIPPMGNEVIGMLKTTALVSVIAGRDLLTNLQTVYGQTYEVIPLLTVASIWYLAVTTVLSLLQGRLESRFGRGVAEFRR